MDGDGSGAARPADPHVAGGATAPRKRGRPASAGLADRRREQLTRAAYEVFVEYPYDEAPVSEISRRAGVGQGTLYRYVDGKRELLDLVVDWCADRFFEAVDPDVILAAAEADDPAALRAVIADVGDRLSRLVDDEPGLLRILSVQGGAVDRELRYRITGIYNTVDALVVRVLSTATENGWVDLDDAQTAVIARVLPSLALPGVVLALAADGRSGGTGQSGGGGQADERAEYVAAAAELARHGLLGAGRRDG